MIQPILADTERPCWTKRTGAIKSVPVKVVGVLGRAHTDVVVRERPAEKSPAREERAVSRYGRSRRSSPELI